MTLAARLGLAGVVFIVSEEAFLAAIATFDYLYTSPDTTGQPVIDYGYLGKLGQRMGECPDRIRDVWFNLRRLFRRRSREASLPIYTVCVSSTCTITLLTLFCLAIASR